MDQTKSLDRSQPLRSGNTSTLSFDTFVSSNNSTTSTTLTIPGPGAISGKAVLALGKATLRGTEYLILRRRLQVIASRLPYRDADHIPGIEGIYDDILELSRRDLYPNTIRTKAMSIILSQIGSRQTRHLVKCFTKWPFVEMQIFISYLTTTFDPLRLVPGKISSPVRAYRDNLADWECHSLTAFVDFLLELAQANNVASDAIIESGVMDFLLHLYVSNFHDPLVKDEYGDFHGKFTLFGVSNALLGVALTTERGLNIICGHPLHILWPARPELPFPSPIHNCLAQRARVWNFVTPEVMLLRIRSIMLDLEIKTLTSEDEGFLLEMAADILELSGSEHVELEISVRALRALHVLLSYGKISGQEAIRLYLASSDTKNPVQTMTRIIWRLSLLVTHDTPEWEIFCLPWNDPKFSLMNEPRFEESAVLRIISSFVCAAKCDSRCLGIMVEANIFGLLRPYLELEFRSTSKIAQHGQDNIMVYDSSDFEFLESIRDTGLKPLLLPPPDISTYTSTLRRSVLCDAFNVFLYRMHQENHEDRLPELWRIHRDSARSHVYRAAEEQRRKLGSTPYSRGSILKIPKG